jgi:hypothetical protein
VVGSGSGASRTFSSVFLALSRHRIAQGPRPLGQPLNLRRSSRRPAILTKDIADGFEVGEQFVEEGEATPSALVDCRS